MEIERKFLIRALPPVPIVKTTLGTQGYCSFDPEVRFKSKQVINTETREPIGSKTYAATIKSTGMKVRDEVEGPISKEFYDHMVEKIGLPFIQKITNWYKHDGYELVASIVDKDLPSAFIYSEVEFDSVEEMEKFVWPWPEILIKEVSDDPDWYLQNYWKRSRNQMMNDGNATVGKD